nr:MAG TPA_asm: hypothetical protein [Caudoviricetes sp.]
MIPAVAFSCFLIKQAHASPAKAAHFKRESLT